MKQKTSAERHFLWNFLALQVDVTTFMVGMAFMDAATVLPVFLDRLGATSAMIGATQAIQTLGLMLPPLFAAHWIHGRKRHLRFLLTMTGTGRLALLTLLPALLFWGETRPGWVLAWFFVVYALFWGTDGACHPSWLDIIAKAIPARARGRLFGTMQILGGALAAGAGLLVARVLRPGGLEFPHDFALLLALWCAGTGISQVALMLLREPEGEGVEEERPPLRVYLAGTPRFLREHPQVARIIAARLLLGAWTISAPFYTLYAQKHLGVTAAAAGFYLTTQRVGEIATGILWGYLSDRHGPIIGLRLAAACVAGAPLAALLAAGGAPSVFPVVFFLMGGAGSGVWILANNALLEAVRDSDRPLAVGVASLCQTPTALYGLLGGLLLRAGVPYVGLFWLTLAVTSAGLVACLRTPATSGEARLRELQTDTSKAASVGD
jgi:MFS family permease